MERESKTETGLKVFHLSPFSLVLLCLATDLAATANIKPLKLSFRNNKVRVFLNFLDLKRSRSCFFLSFLSFFQTMVLFDVCVSRGTMTLLSTVKNKGRCTAATKKGAVQLVPTPAS